MSPMLLDMDQFQCVPSLWVPHLMHAKKSESLKTDLDRHLGQPEAGITDLPKRSAETLSFELTRRMIN